nr:MAG TPA: hypothetical protein [Caudoviricetes sp.]
MIYPVIYIDESNGYADVEFRDTTFTDSENPEGVFLTMWLNDIPEAMDTFMTLLTAFNDQFHQGYEEGYADCMYDFDLGIEGSE